MRDFCVVCYGNKVMMLEVVLVVDFILFVSSNVMLDYFVDFVFLGIVMYIVVSELFFIVLVDWCGD